MAVADRCLRVNGSCRQGLSCTPETVVGMTMAYGCHRAPKRQLWEWWLQTGAIVYPKTAVETSVAGLDPPPNSPLRQLWVSLCTPKDSYGCIGCKQVPSCTPKTAVEAYYGCIKVPLDTPKTAMGITVANSYYHVPKRQLLEWWLQAETIVFPRGGGDVAQLVERRTSTPPRQVRFPLAARDFSPSQLLLQTLLRCPHTPVCDRMHQHLCSR